MKRDKRYDRFREAHSRTAPEQRRVPAPLTRPRVFALRLFAVVPWVLYFALVFAAWWILMFDGVATNDDLGWMLLATALPCLLLAAKASTLQRRWIRAQFNLELSGRPGSGGFMDWFGFP